ncbi:MAG: superoxide dismutase [Ignavibacteriae bacterium]|nr:superoxide dismutase [Ignavibacteriota bacterium]
MNSNRRSFLGTAGIATAVFAASSLNAQAVPPEDKQSAGNLTKHELPNLPYSYKALEPHIDAQTMEIHYTKHHKAYIDGLNKAEAELAKARGAGDFSMIQHWSKQAAFHGGGHFLHSLFWRIMAPAGKGGGGEPQGKLAAKIKEDFGSFDAFKKQFSAAAGAVEGSGWGLLHYRASDKRLIIGQAENQHKLSSWGATPILGIDVWEHAYYLKYQNKRADYITAWWNVVNWGEVGKNLEGMM